ncbi:MAG: glycosyltransferase family 4 protein [Ignavibacteriae bacterium]|nr:glycosyltransferase family 4 protein [Ignavibacteriota bacterium]
MKIGVVAMQYREGTMGGTETYLQNLFAVGGTFAAPDEMVLFGSMHNEDDLKAIKGPLTMQTIYPTFGQSARRVCIRGVRLLQRRFFHGQLEDVVDFADVDLLHFPFCAILPKMKKRNGKIIVTIHDLQHLEYPEFFSRRELDYREREYGFAVRHADLILTDSVYSCNAIRSYYGLDANRVQVYQPGIDIEYFCRNDNIIPERLLREKGIDKPYLMYPAATWPHKNHGRLLRAMEQLVSERSFDGLLVLTGISREAVQKIRRLTDQLKISHAVLVLGYVHRTEMKTILSHARILIFPSLFEGYGFPLLEAMAAGIPIACSRVASLPELGGDAVEYLDPSKSESIAEAVWRLWNDEHRQNELRLLGRRRVSRWNLQECSRALRSVYNNMMDS